MSLLPAAALLLGAALPAVAQNLPDPIAPAVIGRPLDELRPIRPAKPKAVKPATPTVAAKPAAAPQVAARPATAAAVAAAPAAPQVAAVAVPHDPSAPQRAAKQAVDDRADPNLQLDDVGKGTHFARKPLGEGAYFGDGHRLAARKYYELNPVMRPAVKWKIGEPVPRDAVIALVPRGLLATLPQVPPGHQYVELGGEVVMIATGSRMVVDGISRHRPPADLLSHR